MHCIRPIKAGYKVDGTLTYRNSLADRSIVGFQLDCRKCLPCRLNGAREKAIRCYHESQMHEENIFLTLTYSDEHLRSPKLHYPDFQNFMKSLREEIGYNDDKKISYLVTGEYGELNKRPHWHAIIFNYAPQDRLYKYTTDRGDKVTSSELIDSIWGKGSTEMGSVTLDSAGYVARYAAKKLVHGPDQAHDFHPIHHVSKGRAIGRSWIEKYYQHPLENGFIVLPNGQKSSVPRYYVDWAKKNQPELWHYYVTTVRPKIQNLAETSARKEEMEYLSELFSRKWGDPYQPTRSQVKLTILQSKFKQLQERLKL